MGTDVKTISVEACRRLIEGGTTLRVVDVRTAAEYSQRHVTGATLAPLGTWTGAELGVRHGAGDPIYVVCEKGGRAAKACAQLAAAGVKAICVEGGTQAWEGAGLPMERGPGRVISLERQVRIGAGALVLLGLLLAWLVHPACAVLSAFVGAGLVFAGVTDYCGMAMVLAKMPWNRGAACRAGA